MTKLQTWTMTGLGLVTLVVGVILAGLAVTNAQSPTPSATPSASPGAGTFKSNEDPAHEANESPEWEAAEDAGTAFPAGGHGLGGWQLVEDSAAQVLGMTETDLHTAFDNGQTLAQIAQSKGMSTDGFKSAVSDKVTAALKAKLDAGDITQAQYDSLTSGLSAQLDNFINNAAPARGPHGGGYMMDVKAAAAEVLGVSESDLRTALDSGQTLAAIAQSKGMSTDDFKSALTDKVTSDLQSRLDAGTITQAQFDQAKSDLSSHIDDIVNGQFHGPGGMGHHGHRGFGGGEFYQGGPGMSDSTQGTSGA
ncbi:MAG TPA: SHOCT domain-containing protein [Dehalococcoidia bacterium]|nr:SHOCT domain-containing protein [Dehalococcoidia bacterium]